MRKTLRIALVFLLAAILVTSTVSAAAPTPPTDPEAVIRAIFTALNAGDVKPATSNIADDAVLVLMPPEIAAPDPNVIQGKKAITDWWTFLVSDKGGFDVTDVKVDGNKVTWKAAMTGDYFTNLGLDPLQAEGVGIVEDGKLKSYIWNMSRNPWLAWLQPRPGRPTRRRRATGSRRGRPEIRRRWTCCSPRTSSTARHLCPRPGTGSVRRGLQSHAAVPHGQVHRPEPVDGR